MDFSWPQEYLDFKKRVVDFANLELNVNIIERDYEGSFSFDSWRKCAAFGVQGLSIPKKYGGSLESVDFLRAMLAMEGFGYGCKDNGLALALNAQMWTVQLPISHFGSEEQRNKFLPKLATGENIGCHALTESNAGSDIFNMEMTAEKTNGGYLLNGSKRLVTLAPIADVAIIFAKTNPKLGKWGVSAFIVEKSLEGYEAQPVQNKMGLRTVPFGEIHLKNCFVSDENLLGSAGAGFSILSHSLEFDRCCILASHLGVMERQLQETLEFVKTRKQFDQPIGKFQSVANRVVNMELRLETSRLLLYKVAWLKSQGKSVIQEAALLKLHLSESFFESSMDAIRSRGGEGYLTELEIERNLRDSVGGLLYAGTSDIQRNIVAGMFGL
ncbi:MAG: alkylation response protein AidB-like acyl-CoA dehydrogenase [Cyclobacteriaceae bacterium]|jgi:alkylation response protein AidB-like acyl-CoA dehydrogenase